jgi:hypothetical protein
MHKSSYNDIILFSVFFFNFFYNIKLKSLCNETIEIIICIIIDRKAVKLQLLYCNVSLSDDFKLFLFFFVEYQKLNLILGVSQLVNIDVHDVFQEIIY